MSEFNRAPVDKSIGAEFAVQPPATAPVPYDPAVHPRAYNVAGQDVTEALKDCACCPGCGVYGRREVVGPKDCFRCRPSRPGARPMPGRAGREGASVNGVLLLLVGLLTGALVALLLR